MIKFIYDDGKTLIATSSDREHIEAILADFKAFLLHAGFHYENVENISYDGGYACERQGFTYEGTVE